MMLKAFIFCLITCLLDVSCETCFFYFGVVDKPSIPQDLLSVTVSRAMLQRNNNVTVEKNMEFSCINQRLRLDYTSYGLCRLHKWLYDSREEELTCVCLLDNSTQVNGQLLQISESRAIPSISQNKFKELGCVKQGQFEFEIKIFDESHPEETVNSLFFSVTNETGVKVVTSCLPMPREANVHTCITSYQNEQKVTWEFPENWSGPARFLKKIDYDSEAINLQIVGMYWPKQLYVDVVVLVKQKYVNLCAEFIKKTVDETLKPKTKCRLEFYDDAVLNPPNFVAKLNLLMPFQWEERNTMEQVQLWLANRLRWRGYQCIFSVQVRTQTASYVPSEVGAEAMDYKFVLIFNTSILGITPQSDMFKAEYCKKLTSLANAMIKQCNLTAVDSNYGRAIVTVQKWQASVWEVQQKLVVKLNMESQDKCLVKVVIATEDKFIK